MTPQEIKTIIMRELPHVIQIDEEVRRFIIHIGREQFADKKETYSRFDQLMEEFLELKQECKIQWESQEKKWEAREKKWEEEQQRTKQEREEERQRAKQEREEEQRKSKEEWKEYLRKSGEEWKEYLRKSGEEWKEYLRKSKEEWKEYLRISKEEWKEYQLKSDERWEEQRKENQKALKDFGRHIDLRLGGLGARWGVNSEESFRNGLKGILEENFNVKVIRVNEFDDESVVFGRPDQIELDIIIKNGILIICELKSSMSKGDMYLFERKARFYEKRHQRKANKLMVISPMIDDKAKLIAQDMGIEIYTYSDKVVYLLPEDKTVEGKVE